MDWDKIFNWKFWQVMKWITGIILLVLIVWLIFLKSIGMSFTFADVKYLINEIKNDNGEE